MSHTQRTSESVQHQTLSSPCEDERVPGHVPSRSASRSTTPPATNPRASAVANRDTARRAPSLPQGRSGRHLLSSELLSVVTMPPCSDHGPPGDRLVITDRVREAMKDAPWAQR